MSFKGSAEYVKSYIDETLKTLESLEKQISIPMESIEEKDFEKATLQLEVVKDKMKTFRLISTQELLVILMSLGRIELAPYLEYISNEFERHMKTPTIERGR